VKGKLVFVLLLVLTSVFLLVAIIVQEIVPNATSVQEKTEDAQHDVGIEWLRGEIQSVFLENRVTQIWDGRKVTYHAPFLHPMREPPSGLPGYLHWTWEAWWHIKEPCQVRYPHQFFWDSCYQAITLSHLEPSLAKDEVQSLLAKQSENGSNLIHKHSLFMDLSMGDFALCQWQRHPMMSVVMPFRPNCLSADREQSDGVT
jgi:hypothetical protein